jgi:hypothetical protein
VSAGVARTAVAGAGVAAGADGTALPVVGTGPAGPDVVAGATVDDGADVEVVEVVDVVVAFGSSGGPIQRA